MSTPFDPARFHEALTTRAFGRNLIFEAETGSTMDVARDAAAHGATEGTVVFTDDQTAGRGRLGRSWITPVASNIAATLVLRPPAPVLREISMIAPLAVVHAIEEVASIRADIKWPNDVQIKGRKAAGILIETVLTDDERVVLVGSGINGNFNPNDYGEIRGIATSLMVEAGREVEREALLASYLAHFEGLYDAAKAGESIRDRWRERLVTLGERVHASWVGGEADGVAEDVDGDGALLVRTDAGDLVRVEAGDVTLRA